jgi:hypothetical protein
LCSRLVFFIKIGNTLSCRSVVLRFFSAIIRV